MDGNETCPVCLKELGSSMIGELACSHVFCFTCISEWSKNMNTCPVDRSKFYSIKVCPRLHGKCIKEVAVEDKSITDLLQQEVEELTYCEVCHQSLDENLLLLCDGCDKGYHMYCLTPSLTSVPDGEWYCARCYLIVQGLPSNSSSEEDYCVQEGRSLRRISDSSSDDNDDVNNAVNSSPTTEQEKVCPSSQATPDTCHCSASGSGALGDADYCLTPAASISISRLHQQPSSSIKHRLRSRDGATSNGGWVHYAKTNTRRCDERCVLSWSDDNVEEDIYYTADSSIASTNTDSGSQLATRSPLITAARSKGLPQRRKRKRNRRRGNKGKRSSKRSRHKALSIANNGSLGRARTVASSPRVPITPQATIRRLVRARCHASSLEEAREISQFTGGSSEERRPHRTTQNEVIARSVQLRSKQSLWWDHSVIERHRTANAGNLTPLNIHRSLQHAMGSRKSLHTLTQSSGCSTDVIGDIFDGMDKLHDPRTVLLRNGKIWIKSPSTHQ